MFPRDLAHPRTDPTDRVSTAHYQPGDYIIRQGEPGLHFYIIESGEVEVLQQTDTTDTLELLNVLGPGDFFGEMALIDNQPCNAHVRARTSVEVVIMGKNIFSHISGAFAPFRDLLTTAMQRRKATLWQRMPMAHDILSQQPLTAFIEPFTRKHLGPHSTFAEAIKRFDEEAADFCCIVDREDRLQGVLTRTDIFRAFFETARRDTPVETFMTTETVAVTAEDSSWLAAIAMHEHGFKWLPVIDSHTSQQLQGYVRAEKMLNVVMQAMPVDQRA